MDNIINKIFPTANKPELLSYDEEGLWSISLPTEADEITSLICKDNNIKIILDATAGLGGNSISFAKSVDKVVSVELDKNRYDLLKNNINAYDINNVELINDSCLNVLNKYQYDAYFFDPPWGGPDYKNKKSVSIKIGDKSLSNIVELIRENNNAEIYFKLPINYAINELIEFNFKIIPIKNYIIICVY